MCNYVDQVTPHQLYWWSIRFIIFLNWIIYIYIYRLFHGSWSMSCVLSSKNGVTFPFSTLSHVTILLAVARYKLSNAKPIDRSLLIRDLDLSIFFKKKWLCIIKNRLKNIYLIGSCPLFSFHSHSNKSSLVINWRDIK